MLSSAAADIFERLAANLTTELARVRHTPIMTWGSAAFPTPAKSTSAQPGRSNFPWIDKITDLVVLLILDGTI
jgi:hypothetical protein